LLGTRKKIDLEGKISFGDYEWMTYEEVE